MDVKELIKLCIEMYSPEEAAERIYKYIQESLILKEEEIKLKEFLKK
jgi:hypothetical protein